MRHYVTRQLSAVRRSSFKAGYLAISIITSFACNFDSVSAQPLFDGADPDILVDHKRFWIYPTTELREKTECFAYSSDDLTNWTRTGPILKYKDISWINDDKAPVHELWAPGIFKEDKKYYLFFAVGPQHPTPSRIGVAVATSPAGPFVDSGAPVVTGNDKFEAIDPMVFKDPVSAKVYLYCGGSAGTEMRVYELTADRMHVEKRVDVPTPEGFTEGPFMHRRGETYYLSYSHGKWNDDTYSVVYSTSNSPLGPWIYHGPILQTDEFHAGPGHHSIFQNPADGQWFIAYHRWNNAKRDSKMPPGRTVCIEHLKYDAQGLIEKVRMTSNSSLNAPLAKVTSP